MTRRTVVRLQVYVYKTSELASALVGLFVHMQVQMRYCLCVSECAWLSLLTSLRPVCVSQYKLPNLTAGLLTRESVGRALSHGITAQQVRAFVPVCLRHV